MGGTSQDSSLRHYTSYVITSYSIRIIIVRFFPFVGYYLLEKSLHRKDILYNQGFLFMVHATSSHCLPCSPYFSLLIRSAHPSCMLRRIPSVFLPVIVPLCPTIDIVVVWYVAAGRTSLATLPEPLISLLAVVAIVVSVFVVSSSLFVAGSFGPDSHVYRLGSDPSSTGRGGLNDRCGWTR